MINNDQHDAFVSIVVAAELSGIPALDLMAMIASKAIVAVKIQGRRYVSLRSVERMLDGEDNHGPSS